jgi:hypothetical protein
MAVPVLTLTHIKADQSPYDRVSHNNGHTAWTLKWEAPSGSNVGVVIDQWNVEQGGQGHGNGTEVASGGAVALDVEVPVSLDDTAFVNSPGVQSFWVYAHDSTDGWSLQNTIVHGTVTAPYPV